MRKSKSNLVIKEQNPWRIFFWMVVVVVTGIVIVVLAFEFGYKQSDEDLGIAVKDLKSIKERERVYRTEIRKLRKENRSLRANVARLKSQQVINFHAHDRIKNQLSVMQRTNGKLLEDLRFYKELTEPHSRWGIKIQSMKIDAGSAKDHTYYFKLTLIQHQAKDRLRTSSGQVSILIAGRRSDGSQKVYKLSEVTPDGQPNMNFSIVYLTSLEGQIKLPAGFEPQKVRVVVYPRGRGRTRIEETYDWPINS